MSAHDELIEELRREIETMQASLEQSPAAPGLIPLKIKCLMASCAHGHHSLNYIKPNAVSGSVQPGTCRDCGERVLELPHPGSVDLSDDPGQILQIATKQQSELMRAHYWRVPFDKKAFNQALRMGRLELERRASARVEANLQDLKWGKFRAPYSGDIIAYAQHATATCCRECASYWHGLPLEGRLSGEQTQFAASLAVAYLAARLPELPDEPSASWIPGVRRADLIAGAAAASVEDAVRRNVENGEDPAGLLMPGSTEFKVSSTRLPSGEGYVSVTHPDDGTLFQLPLDRSS